MTSAAQKEEEASATRKKKTRGAVLIRKLVAECDALEINSAVTKATVLKSDEEQDVDVDVHVSTDGTSSSSDTADERAMKESMRQLVLRLRSRGAIAMASSTYAIRIYRSKDVGDGIDMAASSLSLLPEQCDVIVVFLRATRVQIDDDDEIFVRPGWIVRTTPTTRIAFLDVLPEGFDVLICSPRVAESDESHAVYATDSDGGGNGRGDKEEANVKKKALRMMRKKERNRLKRGANCSRLRYEAELQAERAAVRNRDEYKSRPVPMMVSDGDTCRDDSKSGDGDDDMRTTSSSRTADDKFVEEDSGGGGDKCVDPYEGEDWGRLPDVEKNHVLDVYETIADHFSGTRYKTWPRVRKFIEDLPENSFLLDAGSGNGKNMVAFRDSNRGIAIGTDFSSRLCDISMKIGFETVTADVMELPYRSNCFDAVLGIAVIHHISTEERRLRFLSECVRILAIGGRMLIYAWALEQSAPPSSRPRQEEERASDDAKDEGGGRSKHRFKEQDVFVPWTVRGEADLVVDRYCHVFRKGEIDALMRRIPGNGVDMNEVYYDTGNWCIIATKR